jgi:hypothetical protein
MSDKALLELALEKAKVQLHTTIKAMSIGRNLTVYANEYNILIDVIANLERKVTPTGNEKLIECEFCGEVTKQPVYNRWHGKNCKKK